MPSTDKVLAAYDAWLRSPEMTAKFERWAEIDRANRAEVCRRAKEFRGRPECNPAARAEHGTYRGRP